MTISDNGNRNQYTSGPSQTIFGYTYKIFAAADLKVYLTPVGTTPNPSADLLTLTTEYTVSNVGSDGGGNVTLVTPATTGDTITIERDVEKDRDTDYTTAGTFTALSVNTAFEKSRAIEQQIYGLLNNRGLTYAVTTNLSTPSGSDHTTIPKLGANQIWKMNAAGTSIEAATSSEADGWSTLRTELANNGVGTDGAGLVGYNNATSASDNTVRLALTDIYSDLTTVVANDTKLKVSSDDTTPNYLENKLVAGTNTTVAVNNPGANETYQINADQNKMLQYVSAVDATYSSHTGTIPYDNTIPQITEGASIISINIRPLSVSSKLIIECEIDQILLSSAGPATVGLALFRNGVNDAITANMHYQLQDEHMQRSIAATISSPGASAQTFQVRVGTSVGSTLKFNGDATSRYYGGASKIKISVMEVIA